MIEINRLRYTIYTYVVCLFVWVIEQQFSLNSIEMYGFFYALSRALASDVILVQYFNCCGIVIKV